MRDPARGKPALLEARAADITALDVDAIVNAANTELLPGGGVCGAIHRAAGPELALACARVSPCPTGDARVTPGFALRARHVIHAVGPVWLGGAEGEPELLANAYRSAIRLADECGAESVALPAISTGIYGYPLAEATAIAVRNVGFALSQPGSIERVVFACFSADVLEAYRAEGVRLA